jgi:type I restriction enzyme S subunit
VTNAPDSNLGNVAEFVMGQAPPGKECNKDGRGTPFVKAGEFEERFPSVREWTTRPLKLAKNGDVLVCVVGATAGKVNQAINCAIGRSVAAVRPSKSLATEYLYHFLTTKVHTLRGKSQGLAQGVITREMLNELCIPVPTFDEQRRIASLLDKASALRAKRRAALAELDTMPYAIFAELFGDVTTILEQWPTKKLGELLVFLTSGSRGWAQYYSDSGDLFLRIQNVKRDELDLQDAAYVKAPDTAEAKRTLVRPGDVLLSITADLGRTAVIPDKIDRAFINQHLSILRTKSLVPRFLSAYLASPAGQRQIQRQNRQAVKAGLNFDDIRSFVIPIPPVELQHAFARRLAAVEDLKGRHRTALAELDALFASLQHRAFRGEL